jgi:hypothetical protein
VNVAATTRANVLASLLRQHDQWDALITTAATAASKAVPPDNRRISVSSHVELIASGNSPVLTSMPVLTSPAPLRLADRSPSPQLSPLPGAVIIDSNASTLGSGAPLTPPVTTPSSPLHQAPRFQQITALGIMTSGPSSTASVGPPAANLPLSHHATIATSPVVPQVDHLSSLRSLFDEPQATCYHLMEINTFSRFRYSKIFRSLIESSCAPGVLALTSSNEEGMASSDPAVAITSKSGGVVSGTAATTPTTAPAGSIGSGVASVALSPTHHNHNHMAGRPVFPHSSPAPPLSSTPVSGMGAIQQSSGASGALLSPNNDATIGQRNPSPRFATSTTTLTNKGNGNGAAIMSSHNNNNGGSTPRRVAFATNGTSSAAATSPNDVKSPWQRSH